MSIADNNRMHSWLATRPKGQLIWLPDARTGAANANALSTAKTMTMRRRRMRDLLSPMAFIRVDYEEELSRVYLNRERWSGQTFRHDARFL